MKRIAGFLVEKRIYILTIMILAAVVSVWLSQKVTINTDMTKYLPEDSATKIGITLMKNEFADTENAASFRIMLKGLAKEDKTKIAGELASIQHVESVLYDIDSEAYNKGDYTLYTARLNVAAGTLEADSVKNQIKEQFASYHVSMAGDAAGNIDGSIISGLAVYAFAILMVILFLMCGSWVEPFLFLAAIAMAIFINMGTNIIFESVSDITNSIAAILQLCLSMDYSIMLMNRYKQEKETAANSREAMKNALRNTFSSISSSSITTMIGMLALIFMSFTIGKDLGFVLAKGVLLSLICIFTVLPALILLFDRAVVKTAKKRLALKMDGIARFSFFARKALPVFFVLLFAVSFFLRGSVGISYTMGDYYEANKIFPPDNPVVILYENTDEPNIASLALKWESNASVKGVDAYATTLGRQMTYEELAGAAGMDATLAAQLYTGYFISGGVMAEKKMTFGEFLTFLKTDIAQNEQFAPFFDSSMMKMLKAMNVPASGNSKEMTSKEMASFLHFDEGAAQQLFNYYAVTHGDLPKGRIALYDFMRYVTEEIATQELFQPYMTGDSLIQLEKGKAEMDDGYRQLVGEQYSRLIVGTSLPLESSETFSFMDSLKKDLSQSLKGKYYLVGNSAMAYEMSLSFPAEMNRITLYTAIAIFLVVAIAFRSVPVSLILVLLIQCAVFITMGTVYMQGASIYYLPLLIVQCLLMGATVDYGILYTSCYREARQAFGRKEAIRQALNKSIHTVLTSSSILIAVTGILGVLTQSSSQAVSEILLTIARGGICSTLLVIFVLPGVLSAMDRFVIRPATKPQKDMP